MLENFGEVKCATYGWAGMESQLGNVRAGDAPLQLNSPIPGFSLPQPQPHQQGTSAQTAAGEALMASSSTSPTQELATGIS